MSGVRVDFRRTGGIAGLDLISSADEAELGEHAAVARQLLAAPPAEPVSAGPAPGADRFQYELVVHGDGRSRTVRFGDSTIPDEVRPLIDGLTKRAKPA